MSTSGRYLAIAVVSCLFVTLTACGSSTKSQAQQDLIFEVVNKRNSNLSMVVYDNSLSDWLPSQTYIIDAKPAKTLGSGVIVGKIRDVQPGRAYKVENETKSVSGTEVAFESSSASWRTLDVTVNTEEAWGEFPNKEVKFGLSIDATDDVKAVSNSLLAQGRIVAALERPGFFKYDENLHSVGRSGQLLGKVDRAGNVSFPSLEGTQNSYFSSTPSIQSIESLEAAPKRKAPIIVNGGRRASE